MIVNLLPDVMQAKGVSIRELCRRTGITYTTIRAVVLGERRSIQLPVLDAICAALEIQPGQIYRHHNLGQNDSILAITPEYESPTETPAKAPSRLKRKSAAWNVWE